MRETRIAGRYAKALFDLALEQNSLEEIHKDMRLIYEVSLENRDLLLLLKTPVVNTGKKKTILRKVFASNITELSMRFLELMTQKGRETYLREIAHQFNLLYNHHHNIIEAQVTLAYEDEDIVAQLKKMIEEYTQAKVQISTRVDERLIGGFVLKFADNQYDASLQKKLKNIRAQFADNLYLNKFR